VRENRKRSWVCSLAQENKKSYLKSYCCGPTTFSITTFSITEVNRDTQHKDTQNYDNFIMLRVFFDECHLCWVSQISPLCWVSFWVSLCWMSCHHCCYGILSAMCCACSVIQRCLAHFVTTVSYDRKIFTALATFFVDIEPEFFFSQKKKFSYLFTNLVYVLKLFQE